MNQIKMEAEQIREQIIADRRALHQCPELGLQLPKTTAYVKKRLMEMGLNPKECGAAGFTVVIGNPKAGKVLLLRADMDALPAPEENELPFKANSSNGHLCGHDAHTAMLLGAAQLLKAHEGQLKGAVKLMFQPGEESANGALNMLSDGLLNNPPVDAAIALHVTPEYPAGQIVYRKGVDTASFDVYVLTFHGKGGHSSQPNTAIDPLMMINSLYMQLSSLVGKEVDPKETAVLTVGKMGGGTAVNIIPQTAEIYIGLRCYNNDVREYLCSRILQLADSVASALRGSYTITRSNRLPSVINDGALVDELLPSLHSVFGLENVLNIPAPGSGSEDFSYVTFEVPSALFHLGTKTEGNNVMLHNPRIIINEDALTYGTAAFAACALDYLK